jgi:murein DD-endopeptidase MepM/ murein hydrolase activator NlpD
MRLIRRIWIVPLVLFGAFLYARFIVGLFAEPGTQRLAQPAAQEQQPPTTPFVYPLPARWQVESFVDHTGPWVNPTPDQTIAIYTGHYADPYGTPTPCVSGIVHIYSDGDQTATDLRWDQDLPCAGRTGGPGWLAYDGHPGYDLNCPNGTHVDAMLSGDMLYRGGLAHRMDITSSDGNYMVTYYHLDGPVRNDGPVNLGEYVADSDAFPRPNTPPHLHFEIQRQVSPGDWQYVDPSGWEGAGADPLPNDVGNLWLGGTDDPAHPIVDPIPMGYRDQDGTVHGPFALDHEPIRNAWLDPQTARRLGSPVSDDYGQAGCTVQDFERGVIQDCSGTVTVNYFTRTFLPQVHASDGDIDGWNSVVYIRNMSSSDAANVSITFYAPQGWVLESRTYRGLAADATWEVDVQDMLQAFLFRDQYDPVFTGTAVVAADQDVAVAVRTEKSDEVMAYTGISWYNEQTGWGITGTRIYAPTVFWAPGWPNQEWYATIHVQNSGEATADVSITYYDSNGNEVGDCAVSGDPIPGYGKRDYTPEACAEALGGHYYGAAYISSDQDLAVVVTQEDTINGRASQYNAFSSGAQTLYIPNVMANWYDWTSSFTVQNVGSDSARIEVHYHVEEGSDDKDCTLVNLAPHRSCVVVQDQDEPTGDACQVEDNGCAVVDQTHLIWEGSVVLESDQDIVAVVNQEHRPVGGADRRHQSYSAFVGGGWLLSAPFAAYQYHPDPANPVLPCVTPPAYRSCSHVQNVSPYGTSVCTTHDAENCQAAGYYSPGGAILDPAGSVKVTHHGQPATFYVPVEPGVPCGFTGSLKVTRNTAGIPIAGVHNYARTTASDGTESGDFGASYNMPQRVDGLAPSSEVGDLPPYSGAPLEVTWSGVDDRSGVADYDVQVCQGNCAGPQAPWTDWLAQTTLTSSLFYGDDGVTYSFRCRARDNAGNLEPYPDMPDASTTVDLLPPSSQVDSLSTWQTAPAFPVSWSGEDGLSGVADYDVQVCTVDCTMPDDAVWIDWLTHVTGTSALFSGGQDGYLYYFRCRARDNVGNQEDYPDRPDAHTILDLTAPSS